MILWTGQLSEPNRVVRRETFSSSARLFGAAVGSAGSGLLLQGGRSSLRLRIFAVLRWLSTACESLRCFAQRKTKLGACTRFGCAVVRQLTKRRHRKPRTGGNWRFSSTAYQMKMVRIRIPRSQDSRIETGGKSTSRQAVQAASPHPAVCSQNMAG
jgi:hypothetical protein